MSSNEERWGTNVVDGDIVRVSSSNQVPPSSDLSTLNGEPPSVEETDSQAGENELGGDW